MSSPNSRPTVPNPRPRAPRAPAPKAPTPKAPAPKVSAPRAPRLGNPGKALQGGAQVIAKQTSNRKTALALILGIAFAEMVLSGKLHAVWSALWGPVQPLKPASTSSSSSQGSSS